MNWFGPDNADCGCCDEGGCIYCDTYVGDTWYWQFCVNNFPDGHDYASAIQGPTFLLAGNTRVRWFYWDIDFEAILASAFSGTMSLLSTVGTQKTYTATSSSSFSGTAYISPPVATLSSGGSKPAEVDFTSHSFTINYTALLFIVDDCGDRFAGIDLVMDSYTSATLTISLNTAFSQIGSWQSAVDAVCNDHFDCDTLITGSQFRFLITGELGFTGSSSFDATTPGNGNADVTSGGVAC